jgi:hypothetical protein
MRWIAESRQSATSSAAPHPQPLSPEYRGEASQGFPGISHGLSRYQPRFLGISQGISGISQGFFRN